MGYEGDSLDDLAGPLLRGVERLARRGPEQVGKKLKERVEIHSPTSKRVNQFRLTFRSKRLREPGTLKRSWKVGELVVRGKDGQIARVTVYSTDPIAPYVEDDTRPHNIPNAFGFGPEFGVGGRFDGLFHPGTTGQHMMAKALAEIAVQWQPIVKLEWARLTGREFWRE